jgi:hypothetical protein
MRNPESALDTALLAKLLSMTDSQHDAEALAAIRKANQLLRGQAVTWSELLDRPPAPIELPPGHQRAAHYRDSFRREAIALRLLAFPFWIFVELLAVTAPDKPLNTRGRPLTFIFAFCMLLSVATLIGAGCYFAFEFD